MTEVHLEVEHSAIRLVAREMGYSLGEILRDVHSMANGDLSGPYGFAIACRSAFLKNIGAARLLVGAITMS